MILPNGQNAVVDEAKLRGYLLNPAHPHGSSHALLFKRLLGIDQGDWAALRDALLEAARSGDAVAGKPSPHGVKYEVRFDMAGPRGSFPVLSIWIVPTGDTIPRLVTAYVA